MCLIVFSYQPESDFPLIVAANRDEFYRRNAAPLAWWSAGKILAGHDLGYGHAVGRLWSRFARRQHNTYGTWLGVNRSGRFAALTNFREPGNIKRNAKSRGVLVKDFLEGDATPKDYARQLETGASHYNGYNLVFGDRFGLRWFSNRSGKPTEILQPGLYGVSNALLDTPWPKLIKAKAALARLLPCPSPEAAFSFMADDTPAADDEVQQTGLPFELEKSLSSAFVKLPGYGTRVTSYVIFAKDGQITFRERGYDKGKKQRDRKFSFLSAPLETSANTNRIKN
jgi:uncharacterized protein with NRDE domain